MRKRNRWCGYIKHKKEFDNEKNIGTLVWRDKDGGYRHELTECPVSVLSRSDYYVNAATQWLLVESPPDGWRDMPLSTWQRIRACYVELKWYSNNAGMEGK